MKWICGCGNRLTRGFRYRCPSCDNPTCATCKHSNTFKLCLDCWDSHKQQYRYKRLRERMTGASRRFRQRRETVKGDMAYMFPKHSKDPLERCKKCGALVPIKDRHTHPIWCEKGMEGRHP